MLENITIRMENETDYKEVYEVIRAAFEEEVFSDHEEHHLVDRLRKSEAFIPELSLVAECVGQILGHILFTKIKIGGQIGLALAPVSVMPDYQSQGIGSALISEGHKRAKTLGYKVSLVLGHESYYPMFGYDKASLYGIRPPFEVPDENLMVLELEEGSLKSYKGLVEYAPEFF